MSIMAQESAQLSVFDAVSREPDDPVPEITTQQLFDVLASGETIVFDTRPFDEFALGHIDGSVSLAAKPDVPMSVYVSDVAEAGRLLKENKSAGMVLYCNGPFCKKSKLLAAELVAAGYLNVRRYQLGIPMWRALGGVMALEPAGLRHILAKDQTAVFIDTRDPQAFAVRNIPGSVNLPPTDLVSGIKAAKDDGRLPMTDHNTRIVIFGSNGHEAREVAKAITAEAFHNVAFFDGSFEQLMSRPVFMRRL
ncbi:MAG: rhodanese-like domain-containing protein [Lysobacterales bacterium]